MALLELRYITQTLWQMLPVVLVSLKKAEYQINQTPQVFFFFFLKHL